MSEFFDELTPDRVLHAVERGGFEPTGHCSPLTCLENRVYDIRLEGGQHIVTKFYRPERWSREAILEEHRFLAELRAVEIPVCAPLPFADGSTLHEIEGIHYAVWRRTGGRSPEELGDEELAILGRLLARIHNVGATSAAPHRPRLDSATSAFAPLRFLETSGFLPPEVRRRYRAVVEQVAELYDAWSAGVPEQRIHGDCHRGNLLHGNEGWFFLDFDDFVTGPAVHDVWMLVPGRDAEGERQRSRATGSSADSTRAGCGSSSRCAPSASCSTRPGSRSAGAIRPSPRLFRTSVARSIGRTRRAISKSTWSACCAAAPTFPRRCAKPPSQTKARSSRTRISSGICERSYGGEIVSAAGSTLIWPSGLRSSTS